MALPADRPRGLGHLLHMTGKFPAARGRENEQRKKSYVIYAHAFWLNACTVDTQKRLMSELPAHIPVNLFMTTLRTAVAII